MAGPVTVRIGDRSTRTDCVVGPPLSEVRRRVNALRASSARLRPFG